MFAAFDKLYVNYRVQRSGTGRQDGLARQSARVAHNKCDPNRCPAKELSRFVSVTELLRVISARSFPSPPLMAAPPP